MAARRRRHQNRASRARAIARALHAATAAPGASPSPETALVPWRDNPVLALRAQKALALLTAKQGRFVIQLVETGNARRSVLAAYACKKARTADDIARQLMSHPKMQHAYAACVAASGGGMEKLYQICAAHLSRYDSPNAGDRDRSARMGIAFLKYGAPNLGADAKPLPEALLDEMSEPELRRFVERQEWPAWAAERLRRARFSLRRKDAASAEAPGGNAAGDEDETDVDPARDPTTAEMPPPAEASPGPEPTTSDRCARPVPGAVGAPRAGVPAVRERCQLHGRPRLRSSSPSSAAAASCPSSRL